MFEREKNKKKKWSNRWLTERNNYSFVNLLKELQTKKPQDLHNYLRMNNVFQNLLTLIRPRIERNKTFMRDAASAEENLP
jgi:hypothetical protein